MTTENQTQAPIQVSEDLLQKLKLMDQVTNVGFVLEQGVFAKVEGGRIHQALSFLQELQADLLKDTKTHPEAYKVPGLNVPSPHAEQNDEDLPIAHV